MDKSLWRPASGMRTSLISQEVNDSVPTYAQVFGYFVPSWKHRQVKLRKHGLAKRGGKVEVGFEISKHVLYPL